MAPASPSALCSLKEFMVFPATGLDVRAAPALASLAMQAAVQAAYREELDEDLDLPMKFEAMPCIAAISSPRRRSFSEQLIVRNTFIAAPEGRSPSLDRFYEERQVKSNPPSGALEVAVPTSPRRYGIHKRVMSAVEEALRCDTDTSGEASSTSGFQEGRETCTTGEGTPEILYASATPPPYEASEESWPFVEAEMLDASESLPGLSLPMDVAYYRVPGQQSDMDSGCADRSLASFAESMEQSMEAPSPTSAGLSAVQYFAHTAGPPAALSTEPMLQVSMHGSSPDFQQPATTFRREMLRARGAALVEAAGWRSTGSPTSPGTTPGFLMSDAPSPMNSPNPSAPPGTFITSSGRTSWMNSNPVGQQWRGQQRPMPPPPPPIPPCNDNSSSPQVPEEVSQLDESDDLPSRGSSLHASGKCKPCAFVFEGCNNGIDCQFCHLCEPGERMRRKKEKMSLRREAREAVRRRVDWAEKDYRKL